jgi:CRP-like cAMP-binding protein
VAKPSRDLIKGIPLFADLDDSAADTLASDFIERYFAPDEVIAKEGESGLNFFVVEAGEAAVLVGGEEVRRLGPGDSFGEIALVDKSARSATVTAVTEMRCHALPVWSFRSFAMTHPDVAWKLLELLADRVREANARAAAG